MQLSTFQSIIESLKQIELQNGFSYKKRSFLHESIKILQYRLDWVNFFLYSLVRSHAEIFIYNNRLRKFFSHTYLTVAENLFRFLWSFT